MVIKRMSRALAKQQLFHERVLD